jgi:hypothetical protein
MVSSSSKDISWLETTDDDDDDDAYFDDDNDSDDDDDQPKILKPKTSRWDSLPPAVQSRYRKASQERAKKNMLNQPASAQDKKRRKCTIG